MSELPPQPSGASEAEVTSAGLATELIRCRQRGLHNLDIDNRQQPRVRTLQLQKLASDYCQAAGIDLHGRTARIIRLLQDVLDSYTQRGPHADAQLLTELFFGLSGEQVTNAGQLLDAALRRRKQNDKWFAQRRRALFGGFAVYLAGYVLRTQQSPQAAPGIMTSGDTATAPGSESGGTYQQHPSNLDVDSYITPRQVSPTVGGLADQTSDVLDGTVIRKSRHRQVVPQQLPVGPRHFAGRSAELASLNTWLAESLREAGTALILTINGQAGIGKTALAVHWTSQVVDYFPDGQLYINLKGFDPSGPPASPAEAIREFLDAFEVPPERLAPNVDTQAKMYRSLIAGKRILVVLDNARDSDQVRSLLPSQSQALAVVTSRNRLGGLVIHEHAQPVELGLLSNAEARALLARRLGTQRVMAEPDTVDEVIAYCSGLPLALSIFAARAAATPNFSLSAFAEELREARDRLNALDAGDVGTDLRAVLSWSMQSLSNDAARMFRLLALHPGPDISRQAATCLAGLSEKQVMKVLDELTNVHLIDQHIPGRYQLHDLSRVYATEEVERIESQQLRKDAIHRILEYYLHTAYTADHLLDPYRDTVAIDGPVAGISIDRFTDSPQALEWFKSEHSVLIRIVNLAIEAQSDIHAWQIPWAATTAFDREGHWHDLASLQRSAVEAATRLNDPYSRCWANLFLGHAYARLRQYEQATVYLTRALDLATEVADPNLQARTHQALALRAEQQKNYESALEHSLAMLELYRSTGNRAQEATALNWVGWFQSLLSDYVTALSHCEQALTLLRDLDDRHGQAMTEDSLGYIHHYLGDFMEALACYDRAIILIREVGDRYNEAQSLEHVAATYIAIGKNQAARKNLHSALEIYDELGHPNADAMRAQIASLGDTE